MCVCVVCVCVCVLFAIACAMTACTGTSTGTQNDKSADGITVGNLYTEYPTLSIRPGDTSNHSSKVE